ncbi:Uncharacterised protein [Mycobacteroides abscessus subsp. abscessus]|nr:Uncharacterised protein [Mycobacteroides abscessus subsp. abscessus]
MFSRCSDREGYPRGQQVFDPHQQPLPPTAGIEYEKTDQRIALVHQLLVEPAVFLPVHRLLTNESGHPLL